MIYHANQHAYGDEAPVGRSVARLVLASLLTFARPLGRPNVPFVPIDPDGRSRTGIVPARSVCVEVSSYLLLPLFARPAHGAHG